MEREESASCRLRIGTGVELLRVPAGMRLESSRELDYWEVDPDWDGAMFRSAAQAQRPNGSAELPMEITIKTGRRVCVRIVTAQADVIQQVLDV